MAFHPDLVDAAERFIGTPELQLYKIELWAKYAGAIDYDQPLAPRLRQPQSRGAPPRRPLSQLTTFIFLSDVTDEDGPTRIVPYDRGHDVPFTPLYLRPGAHAAADVPAIGHAGSLLAYRTDVLHRGSNFPAPRRARFSILADYPATRITWGGKMSWPKQSPERWAKLLPQCSVRERDLFGFPRPGHDYWNDQTLADVAARYPGMDMSPYTPA